MTYKEKAILRKKYENKRILPAKFGEISCICVVTNEIAKKVEDEKNVEG